MGNVRFISDLHLGHENMAIKRGFICADDMNEHILKMWNSVVNTKDVTYILGDITMEKTSDYPLLQKLNGLKNIVLGNHDMKNHTKELQKYVNGIAGMIKYKDVILTHCQIHPTELNHRFTHNIHGHVHENTLDDERYINVSCEVVNYIPKLFAELIPQK